MLSTLQQDEIIKLNNASRELVQSAYEFKEKENKVRNLKKDPRAGKSYTYHNQKNDAYTIWSLFCQNPLTRIISVKKRTKVGCDGLMIELIYSFCVKSYENFSNNPLENMFVNYEDVVLVTPMNNVDWQDEFKAKVPSCITHIYHHGKLHQCEKLKTLRNGLILIDEADVGNKKDQVLDNKLSEAGNVLSIESLLERNNRVVCISATMVKEFIELEKWKNYHKGITMTIPSDYVSHKELLEKNMIQEWFDINSVNKAKLWIYEDILLQFKDPKVNFIRGTDKTKEYLFKAVKEINEKYPNSLEIYVHDSDSRLSEEKLTEIFEGRRTKHVIIFVKGFYRRANLIPNKWKENIGAVMEYKTEKVDVDVQIQGLSGRMTGYIRELIDKGWRCIIRTSIEAIKNYEAMYNGEITSYSTSSMTIDRHGRITSIEDSIFSPKYQNLIEGDIDYNERFKDVETIPVKIVITEEEYKSNVVKKRSSWDIEKLFTIIEKYNKELCDELRTLEKDEIYQPRSESGYLTNIKPFLDAIESNTIKSRQTEKFKGKDTYQLILYKRENTIIISRYYGSKLVARN